MPQIPPLPCRSRTCRELKTCRHPKSPRGVIEDKRPLLTGDRISLADCTLQASLQFIRFVEADVLGDRPLLRAWDQRYRENRPRKPFLSGKR